MKTIALWIAVFIAGTIGSFGQTINSEDLLILNDSIKLPGTLSYQSELQKQPLAIFIQGSGNPDRDGNQLQMNVTAAYLKQMAEALNNKGIATFRFDKRNVTSDNHKFILKKYVFDDLVSDVSEIITHFSKDERFSEIILIGHSQGSLVGMLAVDEHVSKYVSLSGLGQSADKTMIWQISQQNKDFGNVAEAHFKELKETGTIKEINPFLVSIFAKQNHEFLRSYIKYDPVVEIAKLTIPVLIVNGNKDFQVTEKDAQLLKAAKPDAEYAIIDGMNHVLKQLEEDSDNMKSYFSPDYPISTELVSVIIKFIKG